MLLGIPLGSIQATISLAVIRIVIIHTLVMAPNIEGDLQAVHTRHIPEESKWSKGDTSLEGRWPGYDRLPGNR